MKKYILLIIIIILLFYIIDFLLLNTEKNYNRIKFTKENTKNNFNIDQYYPEFKNDLSSTFIPKNNSLSTFDEEIYYETYSSDSSNKNTYLNGIDIIYWINMDESTDRKNKMLQMFKDPVFNNIKNERINAINGKKANLYSLIQTKNKNNKNSLSEFGCLLSHFEAIRTFSNSKYNIALILEDDCTLEFKKYWIKKIKDVINEIPKDWDIIKLYYGIHKETSDSESNWNNKINYTKYNNTSGAMSYLINKKAAINFINKYYVNNKYILNEDQEYYLADFFIFGNTKTYVYKFPYFIFSSNNNSTLHSDHLSEHYKCKQILINKYEKYYNSKKSI